MTIYLDIIFIENLFMNYIILFGTGYVMKIKMKHRLLFLSSILGSIYAIFAYAQNTYNNISLGIKILLSILMVFLAYIPKSIKQLLKELLIFYLISFAFAGCAIFLLYIVKPENIIIRNGVFIGSYPLKIVSLGGIIGFFIVCAAFKSVKNKMSTKDMVCNLKIRIDQNEIKVRSLIDSGNMLKDPISGMPVIVVEKSKLENIVQTEILENLTEILNGKISENSGIDKYISKFRVIPFSSLGMQNGMLLGMKVEEIKLEFEGEIKTIKNVVMAIYEKKLSKTGNYAALVGLDLIERGTRDEFATNIKK